MEILLVVAAQHRNQYYSRSKSCVPDRFASSPSSRFKEINCRTFQSGVVSPCATKKTDSSSQTSPYVNSNSEDNKKLRRSGRSSPIPINLNASNADRISNDGFSHSELWAGPAYSNSPPPSSLPIPKFSLRPKRSLSLDLPGSASEMEMHPVVKSAPVSPTREPLLSPSDSFLSIDSATKNLRRILHLDMDDDE